jgi:hypothetical protein
VTAATVTIFSLPRTRHLWPEHHEKTTRIDFEHLSTWHHSERSSTIDLVTPASSHDTDFRLVDDLSLLLTRNLTKVLKTQEIKIPLHQELTQIHPQRRSTHQVGPEYLAVLRQ